MSTTSPATAVAPMPTPAVASDIPGAEQFDTTGMTQEDLAILQNVVQTQGRPAARALMHQW
jgi:hypothetical protein